MVFYYSPLLTFTMVIDEHLKYFEQHSQEEITRGCFLFFVAVEMLIVLCSSVTLVVTTVICSMATMRGILMDLPNILPFAILALFFVFYLWRCYIPYPRKYSKLANTLYKCYIATRGTGDNQQVQNAEDDMLQKLPTKYIFPIFEGGPGRVSKWHVLKGGRKC